MDFTLKPVVVYILVLEALVAGSFQLPFWAIPVIAIPSGILAAELDSKLRQEEERNNARKN